MLRPDTFPPLVFLVLAAGINLLIVGYTFGNLDQLLYLALVPRYFDPSTIHPNDVYLSLFFSRSYTTLFLLLAPLIRWFGWEWPVFIAFALVKLGIFWGIWALAKRFTRDRLAAALAVLFLVMNGFMKELSVQYYSINFICRFAVIPFLLFGLERLMARRFTAAAVLFGLAFQIHAMSTLYWLVVTCVAALWNYRELMELPATAKGRDLFRIQSHVWRRMLTAAAVFLAFALPILIWRLLTPHPPLPADYSAQEWFEFSRHWKHSYIFFSNKSKDFHLRLVLTLALMVLPWHQLGRDGTRKWFYALGLATLGLMGIHFAVTEWIPFQPMYQLQWFRATDILPLLATIGMARLFAVQGSGTGRWISGIACACFLTALNLSMGYWIYLAGAALLAASLSFEKGRRPVSAGLALLVVLPAIGWNFWRSPERTLEFPNVSIIFWAIAGVLFTGLFYCQPSIEGAEESTWRRRMKRALASPILWLLAGCILFAPDWQMGHWRRRGLSARGRMEHYQRGVVMPGHALNDDFVRLQRWARANTPKKAMFFVPPGRNGFRVFSERSVFVEDFDGEAGIFSATLAQAWQQRMSVVGYDPSDRRGRRQASRTYHRMSAREWQDLARQYDAWYVVTYRRSDLPFEQLHQEGRYTIWKITPPEPDNSADRPSGGLSRGQPAR